LLRSKIRKIAAVGKRGRGGEFLPRRVAKRLPGGIFPTPLFLSASPERKSFLFCRAKRGNQNSQSGFSSKKSSDFVQKVPPVYHFKVFEDCCLAIAEFTPHTACCCAGLGLGKNNDFIRIFEIQKQFLPAQRKFGLPKANINLKNLLTNLFYFAFGERQSDN
jgi:hypothetical protein